MDTLDDRNGVRIQYAVVKMDFGMWNSRVIDINENGVHYITFPTF